MHSQSILSAGIFYAILLIFDKVEYDKTRSDTYFVDIFNPDVYIPSPLSENFLNSLPKREKEFTHSRKITAQNLQESLQKTREILEIYKKAKLVITTRLHCALPCRAFGTPVIFVHPDYKINKIFSGLYQEINGSDGRTSFEKLESKIDYDIIAKDKENLLSDLKQRIREYSFAKFNQKP